MIRSAMLCNVILQINNDSGRTLHHKLFQKNDHLLSSRCTICNSGCAMKNLLQALGHTLRDDASRAESLQCDAVCSAQLPWASWLGHRHQSS